jgi:outer membrane protein OmpA-like peptidoglycan-associated protein
MKVLLTGGIKIPTIVLAMVITGCSTMDEFVLLDTAPQHASELRHPEWAEPQITNSAQNFVEGPYGQRKSDELDSIARFLSQQGIAYEMVSGGHTMILLKQKVNFNTGSSMVSADSQQWLKRLGVFLSNAESIDIVIDGHTDSTGTGAINEQLSEDRALRVKNQLLSSSVPSGKIYTRGYGEYMPACNNQTRSGKACNRRVELTLIVENN